MLVRGGCWIAAPLSSQNLGEMLWIKPCGTEGGAGGAPAHSRFVPCSPVGYQALPKPMCSTDENVWAMVASQELCCTGCGDTGMVTPLSLETGTM